MHYIRFLKPPRLLGGTALTLTAKITVTTDLGESFLFSKLILLVELELGDGTKTGQGHEYLWNGQDGMRSVEVKLPVSSALRRSGKKFKMLVRPKEDIYAVDNISAALGLRVLSTSNQGCVVAVRSMDIDPNLSFNSQSSIAKGLAERVFKSSGKGEIRIWEETGESIARHIWDAGLILSSYLVNIHDPLSNLPELPKLKKKLIERDLNVLELGAGCGIVGIALATTLRNPQILLSDLPEAVDILTHNLALKPSSGLTHQILDWSEPLPPKVQSTKWDVVVVADCTYNPDVVPDLVATLGRVAEGKRQSLVVLAMKVRHESEMVFFELMNQNRWVVDEKAVIPLPVLGGEDEQIEIYIFSLRS